MVINSTIYFIVFIFGLLLGNYASTVLYRLPRNIVIYGFNKLLTKPPFCGGCNQRLKFYEYLPLISWFTTKWRCNYCGCKIPYSYTILEGSIGCLSVLTFYLLHNNFELYFLILCFVTIGLLAILIYIEHKLIFRLTTALLIFLGALYRTLIDYSILPWLINLSLATIISIWLLKDNYFYNNERQKLIHSLLPASIWCIDKNLIFYSGTILIVYIWQKFLWQNLDLYLCSIAILIILTIYATTKLTIIIV